MTSAPANPQSVAPYSAIGSSTSWPRGNNLWSKIAQAVAPRAAAMVSERRAHIGTNHGEGQLFQRRDHQARCMICSACWSLSATSLTLAPIFASMISPAARRRRSTRAAASVESHPSSVLMSRMRSRSFLNLCHRSGLSSPSSHPGSSHLFSRFISGCCCWSRSLSLPSSSAHDCVGFRCAAGFPPSAGSPLSLPVSLSAMAGPPFRDGFTRGAQTIRRDPAGCQAALH